jgi:hypothetical protein
MTVEPWNRQHHTPDHQPRHQTAQGIQLQLTTTARCGIITITSTPRDCRTSSEANPSHIK